MKLQASTEVIERGNVSGETQFTIKASAKAFAILSSSLYSDKILAIVRELSTNAYDAHVAAGCPEKQFELKLPSAIDPTFHVKDFGTGLSHDQITSLYTTYFDSTKTNSDEFVGALGLGSKSPFAYTSSFTIESRYNGKISFYSAFINEAGLPSVVRMGDPAPTDEPNGLTVGLSVLSGDYYKFHDAAKKALVYFTTKPNIIGYDVEVQEIEYTTKCDTWGLRKLSPFRNGAQLIQGGVAYPVDGAILVSAGVDSRICSLLETDVDLFVPIGYAEVAPSREALSYNKHTIASIVKCLENMNDEMIASFQAAFDGCGTFWEACTIFAKDAYSGPQSTRAILQKHHEQTPFVYNGRRLTNVIEVDTTDVNATSITTYALTSGRRYGSSKLDRVRQWFPDAGYTATRYQVSVSHLTKVIVDDVVGSTTPIIDSYLRDLLNKTGSRHSAVVIRPVNMKAVNQAEIDLFIERMGNPVVIKMSSLPDTRAARKRYTGTKREKGTRLKFVGFNNRNGDSVFSRLCWKPEQVELDDGGFFIPLDRFTPVVGQTGVAVSCLDSIISNAEQSGLFIEDEIQAVYGFSAKEVSQLGKDSGWVNFFEELVKRVEDLAEDTVWGENLYQYEYARGIGGNLATVVNMAYNSGQLKLVDGLAKSVGTLIDRGQHGEVRVAAALSLFTNTRRVELNEEIKERARLAAGKDADALERQYPMLAMVCGHYRVAVEPEAIQLYVDYINLVDSNVVETQELLEAA